MPFSITYILALFLFSVFFLFLGYRIKNAHNNKLDEAMREITKCRKCGATKYQFYHSNLDYYEDYEVNYSYTHKNHSGDGTSEDFHEPSTHIFTHFLKLKCLNCGNLMFDGNFEFGTGSHSSDKLIGLPEFKPISASEGYSLLREGLRRKLFSDSNNGCEKTFFLISGYGLMIVLIVSLVLAFT